MARRRQAILVDPGQDDAPQLPSWHTLARSRWGRGAFWLQSPEDNKGPEGNDPTSSERVVGSVRPRLDDGRTMGTARPSQPWLLTSCIACIYMNLAGTSFLHNLGPCFPSFTRRLAPDIHWTQPATTFLDHKWFGTHAEWRYSCTFTKGLLLITFTITHS